MIPIINQIADEPDATMRVKALVRALRTQMPGLSYEQDAWLEQMNEKAAFIAAAIVSGGHVHEMSMTFHGTAAAG